MDASLKAHIPQADGLPSVLRQQKKHDDKSSAWETERGNESTTG
jgi:hypothetical protein